ncbi:DNA polymerase II, large subunit DP2 [Methanococcus vannielii SB]|uniref:DNA polymerase II large subunit n=1 Tax=Methanococcus vannielii (strain ATCC 35089 / DSM 1224 / JCM 13029 / OCM 148 / SB) TaxID=406327 RepID=DP2L_METVS|nr:DNA polymerase II large subunit [Methanococcus vannielii]A6URH2.1 RecName: Full=DNA polymerase II large subunit; Short=Pol II; AltName: Full=Exodeoxyribonuclease large subunit [Methanococcus vannielii SB]ABR55094.1 DNA polymerase II, large subunit DP2 [Methanococcus vannielii SB]
MLHVSASKNMTEYFKSILNDVNNLYFIAEECRKLGYDVVDKVEIPLAKDMADRVEGIVGPPKVSERIRELVMELGKEPAALEIAKEIVEGRFGEFGKEEGAEQAVRTALAVITEGIVAAPLEGIAHVKIKKNHDGTEYLAIYFAGPIRSAGGTAQALAVLVGDYVRKNMNLDKFKPTDDEVERYGEEIDLYQSEVTTFQYQPKIEEIRTAVRNISVEITGEATDDVEVSGHRDLERVETNQIRGGALLALVEGVLLKAPKILRHVDKLEIEGWNWLKELKNKKEEINEDIKDEKEDFNYEEEEDLSQYDDCEIEEVTKFIGEVIAGRPVFAHPSKKGGFRLRYGRSRNTGFATDGFHPAIMYLVDDFMAVGTQLKTERPGKATCVVPVDSIDPPIVKLNNHSVLKIDTVEKAIKYRKDVLEILFLGDILVNYGDFLENNHVMLPSSWCVEWYEKILKVNNIPYSTEFISNPSPKEAVKFAITTKTPLHPVYTYHWHDISKENIYSLRNWILRGNFNKNSDKWEISYDLENPEDISNKRFLELIGCCHEVVDGKIFILEYYPLLYSLGYDYENSFDSVENLEEKVSNAKNNMHLINLLSHFEIRRNTYIYVGARMGRPEKAASRKMKPPVNGLFPIGNAGALVRLINKAVEGGKTDEIEISNVMCSCGKVSLYKKCPFCGKSVIPTGPTRIKLPIKDYWYNALENLKINKPGDVKCIKGMTSKDKIIEPLEKAILRAVNDVYVFKDGTTRFDCTDVPVTHFKPCEINVSVNRLKELGYLRDINGNSLENDKQVLELKVQDVIVPESCMDYFLNVSKFIDDLLEKYYKKNRYYNSSNKEDLVGHLIIGMAPHTSAGMVGRIVGYSKANVGYAHPYFHASKRRNCDGDEDAFFLLLDAFLNFSKKFLPDKRGGQMDAPLVLTTILDPKEVDGEVHNMDSMWEYPLEFYEKSLEMVTPKEIKKLMETVEDRLGKDEQYEGIGYTHETLKIDEGPLICSYKTLGSMMDKTSAQLAVAKKIRATDERDVAEKVIQSHFVPDLIGNLRAFSRQGVRCKCGAKYRRIPLKGVCRKCGSRLILTVSKGAVEKYMNVSQTMAEKYNVSDYIKQRLEIIRSGIDSLFTNDKRKQVKIEDFFK